MVVVMLVVIAGVVLVYAGCWKWRWGKEEFNEH